MLMTPKKKFRALCEGMPRELAKFAREKIEPVGHTRGFRLVFDNPLPGCHAAECGIAVTQSHQGDDLRNVEVFARPAQSSYAVKHFVFTGTTDEVIAWLERPELADELEKTYAVFEEKLADREYPMG